MSRRQERIRTRTRENVGRALAELALLWRKAEEEVKPAPIRECIPIAGLMLDTRPRSLADALADLERLFVRKPRVRLCSVPNCKVYTIRDRCHRHWR
jgi:hypothetical protein